MGGVRFAIEVGDDATVKGEARPMNDRGKGIEKQFTRKSALDRLSTDRAIVPGRGIEGSQMDFAYYRGRYLYSARAELVAPRSAPISRSGMRGICYQQPPSARAILFRSRDVSGKTSNIAE